ncbi:MAG: signal peptidase I [Thermoleophilaceae bacterium]|nr:signal peptidase I [Thermoleophilaceae bacterium]
MRRLAKFALVLLIVVVSLLVLAALAAKLVFGAKAYRAPSESMVPTIAVGDRFLTTKETDPERGDVVVLNPPAGAADIRCGTDQPLGGACPTPTPGSLQQSFVMRVVAVGGDRLAIRDGLAVIDGKPQREPYARKDSECEGCNLPREITVPADHVFVMGDNRGESSDSRVWGPARVDDVQGKVRLRYWPVDAFGGL